MGLFSFAESPQLQALLADIADPTHPRHLVRPVLHARLRGGLALDVPLRPDHRVAGEAAGLPIVFVVMALSFVVAALAVMPIREPPVEGAAERQAAPTRGEASPPGAWRTPRVGRMASAIMPSPCDNGHLGRGVAQLGSAYRSGR